MVDAKHSTLDQFIERLQSLREITGGDVPVVVPKACSESTFEAAADATKGAQKFNRDMATFLGNKFLLQQEDLK